MRATGVILWAGLAAGLVHPIAAQDAPGDWGLVEFSRDRGLTTGTVPAPADTVWTEVRTILEDLGLDPSEAEPYRRLANPRQRVVRRLAKQPLSRFFSCGDNMTGPNAETYHVFIRFGLGLVQSGKRTGFEFALYAEAVDVPGGRPDRIACATTGRLELQLVNRLNERFPGTK